LHEKAARRMAGNFLGALAAAMPCKIHTVLADRAIEAPSVRARWRGARTSPTHPVTAGRLRRSRQCGTEGALSGPLL
jgi:hypothetical protein